MNPEAIGELLAQLRDIRLPEPPGWWPPAPGWWILAAILAASIAGGIWRRRQHIAHINSPRYLALEQLDILRARYRADHDAQRLLADISALMRRVALSIGPRREVASLTGEQWLDWINRHTSGAPLDENIARTLIDAPYRPTAQSDAEAILRACEEWAEGLESKRGQSDAAL